MGKALKQRWNNNYPKVEKVYLGRVVTGRKFFGLKKVREPYEMDIRNFVRGPGDVHLAIMSMSASNVVRTAGPITIEEAP